jgi:soluble lytic murein transglycosylase-like protein
MMKKEDARFVAVSAAQLLMAKEQPELRADGKWGSFTQAAYSKASPLIRAQVDDLLRQLADASASELYAERQNEKATAATRVVDRGDIKALIAKAAEEAGVPVETALKIAKLESGFDPKAVSSTGAKGLFQFTSIAVQDVNKRGGYVLLDPFDPWQNAVAGMKFIKLMARDIGASLSDVAKVYMAFNIGPTGAKAVLSGQPERVANLINRQAYGPPAVYAANLRRAVETAVV